MNIKMTFKLLLLASLIVATGCVKQKNCDCGESGTFVYLKKPYKEQNMCPASYVVAHFIPDGGCGGAMLIVGKVPRDFRVYDSTRVNVCLKQICDGSIGTFGLRPVGHSLQCIEMED